MKNDETVSLALELSSRCGSVAVGVGDELAGVERLVGGDRYDDDLMPAVDRLMKRCSVERVDLDEVYVSVGPGGFTGLRLAVTTAKMLALALGVRLVSVPSALVVAESVPVVDGGLVVVLGEKGEAAWVTFFVFDEGLGVWRVDGEGSLLSGEEFRTCCESGVGMVVTDRSDSPFGKMIHDRHGVSCGEVVFDAGACWCVGRRLADAGGYLLDTGQLLPLYAREPEAVRLWQKRMNKG